MKIFLFLSVFWFAACSAPPPNSASADANTYFPLTIGGHQAALQLALNDGERSQGLMFREQLEPNHGMLFLFEQPAQRSFWMRNTQIPLDLAYFDAQGRLLEVLPLYPYDETGVSSRSRQVLIAVEMNQGWFSAHQIRSGAQLDMEALRAALKARGFEPAAFSL